MSPELNVDARLLMAINGCVYTQRMYIKEHIITWPSYIHIYMYVARVWTTLIKLMDAHIHQSKPPRHQRGVAWARAHIHVITQHTRPTVAMADALYVRSYLHI